MVPILILGALTYLIGITRNATLCVAGACICVFALCLYKYSQFFIYDVVGASQLMDAKEIGEFLKMILPATPPLAISFFTFEFVHYLMEVRRGNAPVRNVFDYLQFTIFFPSLVSGPIKRYQQFIPELHRGVKEVSSIDVMKGLLQVTSGYFQKTILADNLAIYIDYTGGLFQSLSLPERWIFLVALALRIYFDFNGYSEIAIGLAKMLGIQLPPNFNRPYLALSIQNFWERWHISLSSWIRDYIYIPLGGGQHGHLRRVLNGLIAFGLCGLWHGAAWNFVIWGIYHGAGLAICTSYRSLPVVRNLAPVLERTPFLSWLLTFLFVAFGWLLFFYPLHTAIKMFCMLFGGRLE